MGLHDEAARRINFTPGRIAEFKCPPNKASAYLWDSTTPGLAYRVRSSGAASYIFQKSLKGKDVRITIGTPATWSIDKARIEARRLQVLIDRGIDPREERAEKQRATEALERERKRASVTLREIWDEYYSANCERWSDSHKRDHALAMQVPGLPLKKRKTKETVAGPLYSLAHLRLGDITSDTLQAWLAAETPKRPAHAARAFRLLRALLHWCDGDPRYKGIVSPSILTKQVRREVAVSQAKDDVLQKEMLQRWFAAVQKVTEDITATYLIALLLTGARKNEMLMLKWADVDFRWNSIKLKDKVEEDRVIPLTPYLAYRLQRLPRINEWVFSSKLSESGRLISTHHAHNRATKKFGLPHLTLHGLRRSFKTLSEWIECPGGISAQIMGHKPSAIAEKHYTNRPLDLLRKWHVKIESFILEQAQIAIPTESESRRLRPVSSNK